MVAWKLYPRGEEKWPAFTEWQIAAEAVGGEQHLLPLIQAALSWQIPIHQRDNFEFLPYFRRYLKWRKWEDEPPRQPMGPRLTNGQSATRAAGAAFAARGAK